MWGIFSGLQAAVPISIKKSDVQISCALFFRPAIPEQLHRCACEALPAAEFYSSAKALLLGLREHGRKRGTPMIVLKLGLISLFGWYFAGADHRSHH